MGDRPRILKLPSSPCLARGDRGTFKGSETKTKTKETVKTETMVPTWEAVLPIYLMAYENGEHKGRAAALSELQRMAKLADLYLAAKKGGAL